MNSQRDTVYFKLVTKQNIESYKYSAPPCLIIFSIVLNSTKHFAKTFFAIYNFSVTNVLIIHSYLFVYVREKVRLSRIKIVTSRRLIIKIAYKLDRYNCIQMKIVWSKIFMFKCHK